MPSKVFKMQACAGLVALGTEGVWALAVVAPRRQLGAVCRSPQPNRSLLCRGVSFGARAGRQVPGLGTGSSCLS